MIRTQVDLQPFNTFGIQAEAARFGIFRSVEELKSLLSAHPKDESLLILGGGSNLLFTKNFDGLVLKNEIKGIEVVQELQDEVILKAGAGERWHDFVLKSIELDLFGLENLSLIPGTVGASPIQNIGAYGVEVKDVFHSLEAYHIDSGSIHTFFLDDCAFGYRDSIFKNKYKGQYVILSVSYRLRKTPNLRLQYGAIAQELANAGIQEPAASDISDVVIRIRQSKLPDPTTLGNAGSFFKNPVITLEKYTELKNAFPEIPSYPVDAQHTKVPAGWLIEQAGWKGKRIGNCGVHENQALVLVNYGGATGTEIFNLSERIVSDINQKFGIRLEREVNIH